MNRLPPPAVPWQITGNHWLALPCIHPADGAVHAVGVLHRGARAAVEMAGSPRFLDGDGTPLVRPVIRVNGAAVDFTAGGLAWERASGWLPSFTATAGDLVVRGTIFAPHGRDADVAGAVYAIGVENRGASDVDLTVALEATLGYRQIRVRTARGAEDANRVAIAHGNVAILEGAALPGLAALAVGGERGATLERVDESSASFAVETALRVAAGARVTTAFYIAAGPERDGARATVEVMRRRGWSELLTITRDALAALEQTVGHDGVDRLINRNLLFAYFYGVGRALDDAQYYLVRTRAPWHGAGVTVRDWEALAWTLPAVQLADAPLARELLLRACEVHGYAPGNGVHYLDGTLFEPGFSLEGAAVFALATDRYIRETADDQIVDEPAVADTLYAAWEDLADRRDQHVPLYATEVTLSGAPAAHPFTLHGNAVAAYALDVFRRTLDEETAKAVPDPEAVRAALRRHFSIETDGKVTFASAIDLAGHTASESDALASPYWLPLYETVERFDSVYRRTVRGVGSEPRELAEQCARLIGPDAGDVLRWFRRAPLDNGLAAEVIDEEGKAVANGGDASLSGLLAWCVWYAVHAHGVRP
ncbi:MAG: hypothetical protein ABJD07_08835 [Gemmatimonadaceae bacterium]